MSGNRVEELEAKVRELEATIDGLTDELVETKERLSTIESETGIEPNSLDSRLGRPTRGDDAEEETDAESETSTDESSTGEETDDEETTDSVGDDIIVA